MRHENRTRLADLVVRQPEELMQLWRRKVQPVPVARNLDTPAACSHIAALLDDVAAALREGRKKSLQALPVDGATGVHGLQRFHEGFNLIEVGADYNSLRETIHEFATAKRIMITGH